MKREKLLAQCESCGDHVPREKLERFGLVWLCPQCMKEAEERQAMQSAMIGGCRDGL